MMEHDPAPGQLESGIKLKDYLTLLAKARVIPSPSLPPRLKPVTPHLISCLGAASSGAWKKNETAQPGRSP